MVTKHTRAQLDVRNKKFARLFMQGRSIQSIATQFGLSYPTVANAIKEFPPEDMTPVAENLVPLVNEEDLLESGLRAAKDKLTRTFIKLALSLSEQLLDASMPEAKLRHLQKISHMLPMINLQAKKQAPKNLNFIFANGSAEDVERKILDFSSGSSQSTNEK